MNRLRRLIVLTAMTGSLLWAGEAQATITPTPDDASCTYTNDNISVCTLKDGIQDVQGQQRQGHRLSAAEGRSGGRSGRRPITGAARPGRRPSVTVWTTAGTEGRTGSTCGPASWFGTASNGAIASLGRHGIRPETATRLSRRRGRRERHPAAQ